MSIVNVVLAAIAVDVITSGTVVVTTGKFVIRLVDAAKDDDTAICNVDVLVDVCCRLVEDILVVAGVLTDIRLEVVVKGISVVVEAAEEHASQAEHLFHVHLVIQSFALFGHHDLHSMANGGLVVAGARVLVVVVKDEDEAISVVDVLVDVCCRLVEDDVVVAVVLTDIRLEVAVKGISVVVGTAEEHASQSVHCFHVHLVLQSLALLGHHDPQSIANGGLVVADARAVVVEQASQAEHLSQLHLVFQSLALLGHHDLHSMAWSFLSTFGEGTSGGFWRKKS